MKTDIFPLEGVFLFRLFIHFFIFLIERDAIPVKSTSFRKEKKIRKSVRLETL